MQGHGAHLLVQLPNLKNVRLPSDALHVPQRLQKEAFAPEREQPPLEVVHQAALRVIDLHAGPHALPPGVDVVPRAHLAIVQELDGKYQGRQGDDLRADVVVLPPLEKGGRGGGERVRLPELEGEAAVERIEDAHGEGDGFHGERGPGEDVVHQVPAGLGERQPGGDEVCEVD